MKADSRKVRVALVGVGNCASVFRPISLIHRDEPVLIGLPDTIWFPEDGLAHLPDDVLSLLCFPVEQPHFFDAVITDEADRVRRIQVKHPQPDSNWIWGAMRMPGDVLWDLYTMWRECDCADEYLGTLINAYIDGSGIVVACWADVYRHGAMDWFDRQMEALADFDVTVTFCFTPEHCGIEAHYTSPPKDPRVFAELCARMIDRYAPAGGSAAGTAKTITAGSAVSQATTRAGV